MIENAINHTRLGWALAQTYTAKGLGVDAGKLKTLRESLHFDTHYTVESGANGTRIYYTKLGILALAKMIGTPKADQFAAECVRSASGALVPVAAAPVQQVQDLGWNPAGQLANQAVYDYIPQSLRESEPEYLDAYPTQSAPISRVESGWDKLAAHVAAHDAGRVSPYTVNYTVNHTVNANSNSHPEQFTVYPAIFYWGALMFILACFFVPIAAVGLIANSRPQSTYIQVR